MPDKPESVETCRSPAVVVEQRDRDTAPALAQAVSISLVGTAPRGSEQAGAPVYFACSAGIQNVVKHACGGARVVLRLLRHHGSPVQ